MNPEFENKQAFFDSGATRSKKFRIKQLNILHKAIKTHEKQIEEALYKDLRKHPTEAYASEIGLVYQEINHCIEELGEWMQKSHHPSNLALFPTANFVLPVPKGIVLIIAPWNYPFQLLMAPLVAAISAGCCAVLKPSEDASHTEKILCEIINKYFEPNYISIVTGMGADVVPKLIHNYNFNHVFFTGSVPVGRIIATMAAEHLIPVTLELGGKSPCIVDKTAKIKIAAKRIAWAKFYNAGQTCIAPDYILVDKTVKMELINALKKAINELYEGNPQKSDSFGRIINAKRFSTLCTYLKDGEIVYGGEYDKEDLYIAPTLIDAVSLDSKLMQDEIFGPILPIISYSSESEIKTIIAKNPNPLSLYVFSEKSSFSNKIINEIPFGGGAINNCIIHLLSTEMPFGGIGNSGQGAYHGKFGFDSFSHYKSIAKSGTWIDVPQKYPPYTKLRDKLVRWLLK